MELQETGPIAIVEVAPRSLKDLGNELIQHAMNRHPPDLKCGTCSLREFAHNEHTHSFQEVVDPLVLALKSFVDRALYEQAK